MHNFSAVFFRDKPCIRRLYVLRSLLYGRHAYHAPVFYGCGEINRVFRGIFPKAVGEFQYLVKTRPLGHLIDIRLLHRTA